MSLYVLVYYSYVTLMYSICRMLLICTYMSSVCHSYVLTCHLYVTRRYWYVIRISLLCTRMSSYVTRMWFYHKPCKQRYYVFDLTDLTLDHFFHGNIIAYCQHNWYVWLAIYAELFTLSEIGFCMECFTTDILHIFLPKNVKIWLLGGSPGARHLV